VVQGALGLVVGCHPDVEVDAEETGVLSPPALAEFDPLLQRVPFPNNLLKDPLTHRLALPAPCGEEPGSAAAGLRASLGQLDGFGTSKLSLRTSFNKAVDAASSEGRVFLVRLASHGVPLTEFEGPIAVDVRAETSVRADPSCATTSEVEELVLAPRAPLLGASTYAAVLLRGITSTSGAEYEPAATWALVRQAVEPVQIVADPNSASMYSVTYNATPFDPGTPAGLATLVGLDRLWRAHAPVLGAFDRLWPALVPGRAVSRDDVLIAWSFDTQTITDPLDATLDDSPAALVASPAAAGALSLPAPVAGAGAPLSVEAFFGAALPGVPCSALGCDAIGWVYAETPVSEAPTLVTTNFQTGDDCDPATITVPGAWSDPVQPVAVCAQTIPLLVVVPSSAPGDNGYPTVIFGHGLGRSKEDVLALAGALAARGIASVALDAVDHGARAVQVSTDASLGCGGAGEGQPCPLVFGPTCAPQCFAPILSLDLAAARDSLRQTVLDQMALAERLRGCSAEGACDRLWVDADHLAYVGQSLGALIGAVTVPMSGVPVGVLNVGGADWVQVVTDTDSVAIRCPLIDGLITSGVLEGELWNGGTNPNAACLGEDWKTAPGFVQFAQLARWILDPVDGVNYAPAYTAASAPSVLLAEVIDDPVVPNSATEAFGALLGPSPERAALATAVPPAPSPAAALPGTRWIRYSNVAANAALSFPGNAYSHGSLLAPADPADDQASGSGELGTLQMQVDTLTFLSSHQ